MVRKISIISGKKCVKVESSTVFNLDVAIMLYIKNTFGRLRSDNVKDDYLPSKWALNREIKVVTTKWDKYIRADAE